MRCQLCGYEFDPARLACHAECPLGRHCNLICCPNCGYQVVNEAESRLAKLVRRWWPAAGEVKPAPHRVEAKDSGQTVVPLTHIPAGKQVEIESLEELPPARLAQLSAFGLIPGSQVMILQRRPAHIIRLDQTELALGPEILERIWVRVPG